MSESSWILREIHGKIWDHEVRLCKIEAEPNKKAKPLWTESRSIALAVIAMIALVLINVLSVEKIEALIGLFRAMRGLA